ncbi:cysteine desulfurase family protein [Bacillus testis]|uniref:cysteine desulfurase family protein n=1 Tax=Bacillus testis TaxID=1622072 RepID=UPI00067E92FD|nr:IscS subfamily cysteine desulfurase [Bacillus testis]
MKYFDYAASSPISQAALDSYLEASQLIYGNASSLHDEGSKAADLLDYSRQLIAQTIPCSSRNIIFTSGGTESNMLAIQTLIHNSNKACNHIISSSMEHPSILHELDYLQTIGYEVDYIQHLPNGLIDIRHFKTLLKETTCLVIVQHVNSEIGIIQPIKEIAELLSNRPAFLHVDCVQSFGKLPISSVFDCADSLSISSHKVGGPKGSGALIFPAIQSLQPPRQAIPHESGFRAGTENIAGAYAFAVAADEYVQQRDASLAHIKNLRETILKRLSETKITLECIEGPPDRQLPHILCLFSSEYTGQYVMMELNRRGFCVSAGSACQSRSKSPSKAMLAIGKREHEANATIRVSFGKSHTIAQCQELTEALISILQTEPRIHHT